MSAPLNPTIEQVTNRIEKRSAKTRAAYLDQIEAAAAEGPHRKVLSCGNLARIAGAHARARAVRIARFARARALSRLRQHRSHERLLLRRVEPSWWLRA